MTILFLKWGRNDLGGNGIGGETTRVWGGGGAKRLGLKRVRVPRFTGKTRITGKTAEIPERPKNNRELKYAIQFRFNCLVMY